MGDGGWIGVVSLTVTGLFALLNKWETNKHDAKIGALQVQNADQERRIKRHGRELRRCRAEHEQTKATLEQTRAALASKTAMEHKALQDQIDVLKHTEYTPKDTP